MLASQIYYGSNWLSSLILHRNNLHLRPYFWPFDVSCLFALLRIASYSSRSRKSIFKVQFLHAARFLRIEAFEKLVDVGPDDDFLLTIDLRKVWIDCPLCSYPCLRLTSKLGQVTP